MGILSIYGNVNFSITLDPGVWIFDERKVDLDTHFLSTKRQNNENVNKPYSLAKHWEEGVTQGTQLKTEKKFKREEIVTKSYGIPFKPFLTNAEPRQDATKVIIEHGRQQKTAISLAEAYSLILGFSHKGKPLVEDGPVHVYFGDGSNKDRPLKKVKKFQVV